MAISFSLRLQKNQLNVRLQALKVENGALKAQNFLTASFKRLQKTPQLIL